MGQRFRRGFTAAEKTELWDRWKRGESLKAIGRAFGKPSSSIYFLVAPHGGIRPALRRRSRLGIDAVGARGDLQRCYGTSIGTIDRQVAWLLIPGQAAHLFRDDAAHLFRLIVARHSD